MWVTSPNGPTLKSWPLFCWGTWELDPTGLSMAPWLATLEIFTVWPFKKKFAACCQGELEIVVKARFL